MNFSLKLCGLGALSFGCTAAFVSTIHALGFQYELLLFLILFAIGLLIIALAGWALVMAIYFIMMLVMQLLPHTS